MTDTPIYTKVKNLRDIERAFCWAGQDVIVVPAQGEATVPFDVWSKADEGQRISIKAAAAEGSITLTVGVRSTSGNYVETEMLVSDQKATATVTVEPVAERHVIEEIATETDHVIVAHSSETESNKAWYNVNTEAPVEAVEKVAEINTPADEPEAEEEITAALVEEVDQLDEDHEKRFNELCANKKWNEALALLKEVFGEARITFGTRALMSLKTWKAVREKYGLTPITL